MTVKEFKEFLNTLPENNELLFTYSVSHLLTPDVNTVYTLGGYNKMCRSELGYYPFESTRNAKVSIIDLMNK